MSSCPTPISALADQVQNRLEETVGDPGIFWSRQSEIYTGLIEAMNDLMLLVGRPTQMVRAPFDLQPNTVWQSFTGLNFGAGGFGGGGFGGGSALFYLITDIQGPQSELWKVSLYDMDYVQASWGSDWENDVADNPLRWFPLGLNAFGIHPAVSTSTTVLLTGILCPVTEIWPYNGAEIVPFHHEFFAALEEYAAHYCRIKETGAEFEESLSLYQQYLSLAERMSQLEDRRDPLIFNKSVGGPAGLNPIRKR
jgi:hypothetical protein